MNIELRFRKPYDIYAVLEDVRGVVLSFHSRDPNLVYARAALRELSNRSIEDFGGNRGVWRAKQGFRRFTRRVNNRQ